MTPQRSAAVAAFSAGMARGDASDTRAVQNEMGSPSLVMGFMAPRSRHREIRVFFAAPDESQRFRAVPPTCHATPQGRALNNNTTSNHHAFKALTCHLWDTLHRGEKRGFFGRLAIESTSFVQN
jgi:hypothetical protein